MGEQALDLSSPRAVHIVGLGGAHMSAIASVLVRMGHTVSGSDLKDGPALERLRAQGVEALVGHDPAHVPPGADAVVVSTAIPEHNAEVRSARERGLTVVRRAEALAALAATRRTVAVSGTHGKTTTSSMVALMLRQAGWRPSFLIGGELNEVGSNALLDEGEWLVLEADESDGTFLELGAEAVVVTNVEADHLDHYGSFEAVVDAFRRFLADARLAVVCADDAEAAALAAEAGAVTYGFAPGATYRVDGHRPEGAGGRFRLHGPSGPLGEVRLQVPGRHNVLNAAGAAALCLELGAPFDAVAAAMARFAGVARRFQYRGEFGGVTVVDDYAHLPTEVRATLSAAREGSWERVIAVFQPHRYSRTEALGREFAGAFDEADVLVLTDVYPAGEPPRPGVSGRVVLQAVLDAGGPERVVYLPARAELAQRVRSMVRPGDLVLLLGAGDVTAVADELVADELVGDGS